MPDYTVSGDVDSMLRSANDAAIRSAIGVGTTDAPTLAGLGVQVSTNGIHSFFVRNVAGDNIVTVNTTTRSILFGGGAVNISTATGYTTIYNNGPLAWAPGGADSGGEDLFLRRDAPGILAQRNGTNAQAFRVYNTYPGTTANEWFEINWGPTGSNIVKIGTAHAGTGGARAMQIVAGNQMQIGGGGAVRWEMGVTMLPLSTDGVADIGQTGNRLRNIYMASWIRLGVTTVASLPAAATAGAGARMLVSDALAPTFGSAVASGGSVTVPVYSTGSAWNVG